MTWSASAARVALAVLVDPAGGGQRGLGLGQELADAGLGVLDGAAAGEQPAQLGDLVLGQLGVAEGALQQRPAGPVGALAGQHDQVGLLALAQVVPGRLAGDLGGAEHPEDVVAELEGLAQRQPVGRVGPGQAGRAAGQGEAEVQRPLDGVLARLVGQDPADGVLVGGAPAGLDQVQVLAAHQLRAQPVEHPQGRGQPVVGQAGVGQGDVGPGEGQVAHEHGRALAEGGRVAPPAQAAVQAGEADVHGRAAPPDLGAVHDVVVDEGADVQQLDRAGRPDGGLGGRAVGGAPGAPVAPVHEGRPQPLAPLHGEPGQGVGDGAGVLAEEAEGRQLLVEQGGQRPVDPGAEVLGVQGGRGGGLVGLGHLAGASCAGGHRRHACFFDASILVGCTFRRPESRRGRQVG